MEWLPCRGGGGSARESMTQQRVCNKCGIEGRENGRFAAGERASEESSLGVGRGTATEDSHRFFRLDTRWRGRKEKKAISYHNTLLIANCDAEKEARGRESAAPPTGSA